MNTGESPVASGGAAVITGGASGLGAALARQCAQRGMHVLVADLNESAAEKVAADLRGQSIDAFAVWCDVSDPVAVENLAEAAFDRFDNVDLLVNNAATQAVGHTWDISADQWLKLLTVNIAGAVFVCRAFIPRMVRGGRSAHIANVGSLGSLVRVPIETAYITSKHAILGFSECLAMDLQQAGHPITVSAVLPGVMATDFYRGSAEFGVAGGDHKHKMQKELQQGMPVDEAADVILQGIERRDFWVSSHPEQLKYIAGFRGQQIQSLMPPRLGEMES